MLRNLFRSCGWGYPPVSLKLKEKLGNFEPYAQRFETLLGIPIFKKYPDFKEMLDYLARKTARAAGTSNASCLKTAGYVSATRKTGIDFCYQCDEFPCNKTNFDERLNKIWVLINEKIKETGLEQYYEKTKTRPRYA